MKKTVALGVPLVYLKSDLLQNLFQNVFVKNTYVYIRNNEMKRLQSI